MTCTKLMVISVNLGPEQLVKLDNAARSFGMTRSAFLRQVLRFYFNTLPENAAFMERSLGAHVPADFKCEVHNQ
jgi:metal-responsive CopG/Arc/MetJ family transcriptional regulator